MWEYVGDRKHATLLHAESALTRPAVAARSDVFSNLHSFLIIATNHCGDDM